MDLQEINVLNDLMWTQLYLFSWPLLLSSFSLPFFIFWVVFTEHWCLISSVASPSLRCCFSFAVLAYLLVLFLTWNLPSSDTTTADSREIAWGYLSDFTELPLETLKTLHHSFHTRTTLNSYRGWQWKQWSWSIYFSKSCFRSTWIFFPTDIFLSITGDDKFPQSLRNSCTYTEN